MQSEPWQCTAYYRLGMYASAAQAECEARGGDELVARVAGLAGCGDEEGVRKVLAGRRWQEWPAGQRLALARALTPFMPHIALDVLETVGSRASPALRVGLLLRAGRVDEARRLLSSAMSAGQAERFPELYLYRTAVAPDAPPRQLGRLNRFLAVYGLPALVLHNPERPPGPRNVRVGQGVPAVDGPLVSVLMTCFRTGGRISAAIESVLNQSWRNLELIVVDDASDDDTAQVVQAWVERDARVRLLRLPVNGGTYLAKNIGLQSARGEFVTCHDSDDWSHPLKIETQLRPLLADEALVATTSHWLRMRDDGVFTVRQTHPLMRLNPSSPLFRRERVMREAGAWDCVRTGADSEFLARLRLVFGKRAVLRIARPLALGAHRPGSLMTDAATGYDETGFSPQRLAYWEAWGHWHIDCLRRDMKPRLPADLPGMAELAAQRPFAAPARIALSAEQIRAARVRGSCASTELPAPVALPADVELLPS